MNKFILVIVLGFTAVSATAQKLELSILANTGVSYAHGPGTESTSFINYPGYDPKSYTNNPHGNIQAVSYGFGADVKLVTANHWLVGSQITYEDLHTKINLQKMNVAIINVKYDTEIGGQTIFSNRYININPYMGYRFNVRSVSIDLTPGLDIALGLSSHENGSTTGTMSNTNITTNKDRGKPLTETRLRVDIKACYHNFGLYTGFSGGQTDLNQNMIYATPGITPTSHQVYTDVIRVGLSYRLK